ncbi:MAG: FeoB small GTPase domain-containing protein, partial [Thermoguttaceae bacterium]
MPAATRPALVTIALIGNPNTGKSTLFSALAGIRQHVGNYPGVTVEKKTGRMEHAGQEYELIDLPGLYSLAARSRDEMVAVDVLLGRRKDVPPVDGVVCILDASNLQRHLYLLSQVLELGLPTVVAVNMLDVASARGIRVDLARLEARLGVPVLPIQAHRKIGLDALLAAIGAMLDTARAEAAPLFPAVFEREVDRLAALLACGGFHAAPERRGRAPRWFACGGCTAACCHFALQKTPHPNPLPQGEMGPVPKAATPAAAAGDSASGGGGGIVLPRCLVRRLLLDINGYLQDALLPQCDGHLGQHLAAARARLAEAGCVVPAVETTARYGWAVTTLGGVVSEPRHYRQTATDRIDGLLTHRLWGMLAFAVLMFLIFQAV